MAVPFALPLLPAPARKPEPAAPPVRRDVYKRQYQDWVNGSSIRDVQSHVVIADHQKNNKKGEDYRDEERENPVSELRNRKKDNTTIGRTQ